ncbi:MAG: exodeoxyribonuclease VII large subunit, partial [Bacilli bacterium]|nr:exodeoxyribonuclease VII large subunit [Bacilli bacterium]
ADLRAPTPTAAAELAVPNIIDLNHRIDQLTIRLNENIYKQINYQKLFLDSIKNSFVIKNPMIMYENKQQKLDNILEKIYSLISYKVEKNKVLLTNLKNNNILLNPVNLYKPKQIELNNIISKLELLNPLSILKRGYTLTYINNTIVKSINDVNKDDELKIKFYDGEVIAKVNGKEEEK